MSQKTLFHDNQNTIYIYKYYYISTKGNNYTLYLNFMFNKKNMVLLTRYGENDSRQD